jgi:two-component system sensor histidine kinase HydH
LKAAVKIRSLLAGRVILPLTIAALPAVLLLSSIRTLREIEEQKTVYLRHRVAMLAARLENIPASRSPDAISEILSQEESSLAALQVITRGTASDGLDLLPIWDGRELFRTDMYASPAGRIFRAYVPFHSDAGLRIARIELAASAADFLVVHARHNVIVSSVGGVVLVALAVVALWAVRQAERMRQQQIKMEHLAHMGKMAAVLAHEIRNPLGTIKGFVQLAGEGADSSTRDLLAPALTETHRLESLVNDLLAYGRQPHGDPKTVYWNDIVNTVGSYATQFIGPRPIRFIAPPADIALNTDAALLGQALLNLLRNAVEAIPAAGEGEVRIEAVTEKGCSISIVVTDDGSGISDEALARLFEPFYTTKAFGTGLGLAITRNLVQLLGGELEVRRREGGGTEAWIRLPNAWQESPAIAG